MDVNLIDQGINNLITVVQYAQSYNSNMIQCNSETKANGKDDSNIKQIKSKSI